MDVKTDRGSLNPMVILIKISIHIMSLNAFLRLRCKLLGITKHPYKAIKTFNDYFTLAKDRSYVSESIAVQNEKFQKQIQTETDKNRNY